MGITDGEWHFKGGRRKVKILYSYFLFNNFISPSPPGDENQQYAIEQLVSLKPNKFTDFIQLNGFKIDQSDNSSYLNIVEVFLNKFADRQMVPASNFDWIIEGNSRQVFYLWGLLKISYATYPVIYGQKDFIINVHFDLNSTFQVKSYVHKILPIDLHPISPNKIKSSIIDYFDYLPASLEYKCQLIEQLVSLWTSINKKTPLEWIDRNDKNQCLFVWKCLGALDIPTWFFDPIDESNSYWATIAAFDITTHEIYARAFISDKLRRLWAAERRRLKTTGQTKPYNYTMSVDIQEMMDDLAGHYRWKKHEVVEFLIRKNHAKVISAKNKKNDRLTKLNVPSKTSG